MPRSAFSGAGAGPASQGPRKPLRGSDGMHAPPGNQAGNPFRLGKGERRSFEITDAEASCASAFDPGTDLPGNLLRGSPRSAARDFVNSS